LALYPGWIAAFVLFRLFDIWKPWLVGRADARGDALGVMLDDVIAGVFAAIGVAALAALFHLVLM
jgi:phosphatidylglycerophosphatase A